MFGNSSRPSEFKAASVDYFEKIRAQATKSYKEQIEAEKKKEDAEKRIRTLKAQIKGEDAEKKIQALKDQIKDYEKDIERNNTEFQPLYVLIKDKTELTIRVVDRKETAEIDKGTIIQPTDASSLASSDIVFVTDKKIPAEFKEQDIARVNALVDLLYLVYQKFGIEGLEGSVCLIADQVEITFPFHAKYARIPLNLLALEYFSTQDFFSIAGPGRTSYYIPCENLAEVLKDLNEKSLADLLEPKISEIYAAGLFHLSKPEDILNIAKENNNPIDFQNAYTAKIISDFEKIQEANAQRIEEVQREARKKTEKEKTEREAKEAERDRLKQDEIKSVDLKAKEQTERKQSSPCRGLISAITRLFNCPNTRPKSQVGAEPANKMKVP